MMQNDQSKNYLISIVGPTAVGKTSFAIEIAQYLDCEIVSADSRQFFREMSIGTAKPTPEELSQVTHHFVNSHSILDPYNAGQFERDGLELIDRLHRNNQYVVLVGGSGMYCKAVWEGLDEMPDTPKSIRIQLKEELNTNGLEQLLLELKSMDPQYYDQVDRYNPQRIVRALEVIRATGKPYSEFRTSHEKVDRSFENLKFGLELDRAELYDRIDKRMDQMIGKGLFEEVEKLIEKRDLNAMQTVGYTEIFEYLDGKCDKEEAIRLLKRNSRRYAKRQLTWFKKDTEINWINPIDLEKCKKIIMEKTSG